MIGAWDTALAESDERATYYWTGQLVGLNETDRILTVRSRLVTEEALATVKELEAGIPIVITWSGYAQHTYGIREVVRAHQGTEPEDDARFLLTASFVAADTAQQHLTFAVRVPSDGLAAVRALRRGDWATITSPHRPTGSAAVTTVAAFDTASSPDGPAPTGTYDWGGRLVALDDARGTLTVTSRLVTPEARTAVEELAAGAPIVITWSGGSNRAAGIRAVAPYDGSGLWGGDRFLLPATFVRTDPTGSYLTFSVRPPAAGRATARALRRGDWATLTSPHRPAGPMDAVTTVAAFSPPRRLLGPPPRGTYDWAAELVALDDARGTLTVTSRLVTPEARTAVEELATGAPIVVTWSGGSNRTAGIRAVARYDGSGLWGGDRFLLPATFVRTDPTGSYLTFSVRPPADGRATARALRRGDWATLTSPHRPTGPMDAVTTVAAFSPPRRLLGPPPQGTYDWAAELVALDDARGTLTVTSRLVTPEARTAVEGLAGEAPIIITWSGVSDRADGIRAVATDDGSGLWGGDRFLLPATFVRTDPTKSYLTFSVRPPTDGPGAARTLRQGDWATLTSPHRPRGAADAVTTLAAYNVMHTTPQRTYRWAGELVALDRAEMEVSVSVAAPVEAHVFRYVDRFTAGDAVMLIWTPTADDEVTAIRYIELRDQSKLDHGYVLPVEFVSADAARQRITFKTKVPASVTTSDALRPGSWIRVTAAFEQESETAAIVTVEEAVE